MNEQSPFLETYARQRIHQQVSARGRRPRAWRRTTPGSTQGRGTGQGQRGDDARPW